MAGETEVVCRGLGAGAALGIGQRRIEGRCVTLIGYERQPDRSGVRFPVSLIRLANLQQKAFFNQRRFSAGFHSRSGHNFWPTSERILHLQSSEETLPPPPPPPMKNELLMTDKEVTGSRELQLLAVTRNTHTHTDYKYMSMNKKVYFSGKREAT